MIPIVSYSALFGGTLMLIASAVFYSSYRRNANNLTRNFTLGLFYLAFIVLVLGTPGVLLHDPKIIDIIFDIFPLFFLVSLAYFMNGLFDYLGWQKLRTAVFWAFVAVGVVLALITMANGNDARIFSEGNFIFYEDTRGRAIDILLGIIVTPAGIILSLFYAYLGLVKSTGVRIRIRSLLIASIMTLFAFFGIYEFLFGGATPQNPTVALLIVGIAVIMSVTILSLVLLRKRTRFPTE